MGTEQLGAAIGLLGVGVHDAARQLDQLAHMADKEDFRKMFCCGHIQDRCWSLVSQLPG